MLVPAGVLKKLFEAVDIITRIMYCPYAILLVKICLFFRTYPKTSSMRADDHSTIGAILFAVLTPAAFWNRARLVHCKSYSALCCLFRPKASVQ
jgi:hypothetical protein